MRGIFVSALVVALAGCGEPQPADTGAPGATAQIEAAADAATFEQYWVTTERLDRRTCPSRRCGVVGQLMFHEAARVYETADG